MLEAAFLNSGSVFWYFFSFEGLTISGLVIELLAGLIFEIRSLGSLTAIGLSVWFFVIFEIGSLSFFVALGLSLGALRLSLVSLGLFFVAAFLEISSGFNLISVHLFLLKFIINLECCFIDLLYNEWVISMWKVWKIFIKIDCYKRI